MSRKGGGAASYDEDDLDDYEDDAYYDDGFDEYDDTVTGTSKVRRGSCNSGSWME